MVTFCSEEKTCSSCGKTSAQDQVASYTTFGAPDLDLRPPPMQRETMCAWIEQCTECGYCSHDISDTDGASRRDFINSPAYKAQLSSIEYPSLANKFLCNSMILERENKLVPTAMQALRAAWACDDAANEAGAVASRLRAVKFIDDARAANQKFSEQVDLDRCIQVDALRRAGDFQRAKELLQSPQGENRDDVINGIWLFQTHLVDSKDSKGYTITDARNYHQAQGSSILVTSN